MELSGLFEPGGVRGALGHVVPGIVTVLALALPVTPFLGQPLSCHLMHDIWATYGWLSVLVLALAGYLTGTLQLQLLVWLEATANKHSTRFSRETLAKNALAKFPMGRQWETTAREYFDEAPRSGPEPTWQLWRLCDYHVLHVDPCAHDSYMGRYNAQYVLFANLAVSTLLLCLGSCLTAALQFGLSTPGRYAHAQIVPLLIASGALFFIGLPLMVFRANQCRRDFIERVFPIFYVIVIEEKHRAANSRQTPEGPAGCWTLAPLLLKRLAARRNRQPNP